MWTVAVDGTPNSTPGRAETARTVIGAAVVAEQV
jgi:hypothetical protein